MQDFILGIKARANTVCVFALLTVCLASAPAVADQSRPVAGDFLVATEGLDDPNFAESVVLLLRYDEFGAIGVIINRRSSIKPAEAFPDVDELRDYDGKLFEGGPVGVYSILMLVNANPKPPDTKNVFGNIHVIPSIESLSKISTRARSRLRVYAGHAGWAPGQLDFEIARGGWHLKKGREELVFADEPETMWQQLLPPRGIVTEAPRNGAVFVGVFP